MFTTLPRRAGLFCLSLLLVLTTGVFAQDQKATIEGVVTDDAGKPLPFVSVLARNSESKKSYPAISDTLGRFSFANMPVEGAYSFDFSSFGYQKRSVTGYVLKYGVPNTVMVSLAIDESKLSEVVVVGYGTQKKVNLTGAVNQISGDELRDRPQTNMSSLLQGAMPNLNIRVASGTPGQMGSLNIRGVTSIDGSNGGAVSSGPLVLIDGIPGTMDRLNPEEVESISILKDAASAAIYGARGSFGVILVTTKSGKSGKTVVRYNNSFAVSTPTVSTNFMTKGYDWMSLMDRSLYYIGGYSGYTERDYEELLARRNDKTEDPSRPWVTVQNRNGRDQYVYYGNYDWWDIMFTKWQPMQTHNLTLSGGNDKVNFMINGNLKAKDGIMRVQTDKYSSKTVRAKVSAQLYPWLKVTSNTNVYHSNYQYYGREGGGTANFTHINVHASPAYAPYNPDGTASYISGLNAYDIGDGIFAMLINGNSKGVDRKLELTSINEMVITPIKDLNITANYSYNMYTDPNFYRAAPAYYSLYPGVVTMTPKYSTDKLTESQQFNQVHVANVYADYAKTFAKVHNAKLILGYNQELNRPKKITAARMNISSEDLNDLNLGTGEQTVLGGSSETALMGMFYRFTYDYKSKYLVEANGRFDGSSRFPKGDRWGFFPSVSAGWRVSEENFFLPLKSNNLVSELKLRGSYGSLGNQSIGGAYPYISTMAPGTASYLLDGELAKYYGAPAPVSGSLTWEKVTSYNIGVDVGFLKNRLTASFDRYIRNTSNILTNGIVLPDVFGATEPVVNAASLRTEGFELTFDWRDQFPVAGKTFRYHVGGVLSDARSRITKVVNNENSPALITGLYVGKDIGEIWGYVTDGFFKTDAEAKTYPVDQTWLNKMRVDNNIPLRAGDLRWVDLDGDGKITNGNGSSLANPGDQRVVGNSTPRYQYSFNMDASWNNIDISAFFQGLGKMDWYPGNNADRFWGPYSRPYFSFIPEDFEKDVYSATNRNAYFPNLLAYVALNANNELRATNNRYMQNLAYLRLKNLSLGYTLPARLTRMAKIQRFRVFVSGENMWTWTKLRTKYIDPEQAMANIDGRVYPFSKTYAFGFDVTF